MKTIRFGRELVSHGLFYLCLLLLDLQEINMHSSKKPIGQWSAVSMGIGAMVV